jgi:hypothetical protein
MSVRTVVSPDLEAQRAYVKAMAEKKFDFSLTVADAFVRGIRDLGYKSTATALDELIDNAEQSDARNVHVALQSAGNAGAQVEAIAVIDDGHGMDPEMVRLAAIWGGTSRENDRSGFGRYGYGLPSAAVSQGRRFTVFSAVAGGKFNAVTVDIDAISNGDPKYHRGGRIIVPEPLPAALPDWVQRYIDDQLKARVGEPGKRLGDAMQHGTVVLIDKLDRLTWKTNQHLTTNLQQHFGIVYRNYLRDMAVWVHGKRVEALDPLFITPYARFFDLDEDRAEALEPVEFEVKGDEDRRPAGYVRVRFAYFPPTFGAKDKARDADRGNQNSRFAVMKEHNGFIVLRNGRQIDIVTRTPWFTFVNNDRYWKVEIDFDASLDEEFAITTSKQQVVISERMWTKLREAHVLQAIDGLRKRFMRDFARRKEQRDAGREARRASEIAMQDAEKYKPRRPIETPEQRQRSEEHLKQEIRRVARETGRPEVEVAPEVEAETKARPYKVVLEDLPGAPFYRVEQRGGQKVLLINRAHRFYGDIYVAHDSTPHLRATLEVLLFVIGDCELDASDDGQVFYQLERGEWSKRLTVALDRLGHVDNIADQLEALRVAAEDVGEMVNIAPIG